MATVTHFAPHHSRIVAGLFDHDVWHIDVVRTVAGRRRVRITTYHGTAGTVTRSYPVRRDGTFRRDGRRFRIGQAGDRLSFEAATL